MRYNVDPRFINSVTLNETNTVASVLQNLTIILLTPQQSVPLYREFGLPMSFIDKPTPVAKTMIIAEIHEAVAKYEPRATIISIEFAVDENTPERLIPILEVDISEEY